MVVLKRLGRGVEAKQLANQDTKELSETKTLGTPKTGWLSQSRKGTSKKKDKFSSKDPQTFAEETCHTEKCWTKEKSCKGKENLLPFSSPSALSTKLTSPVPEKQGGVHFANQNKMIKAFYPVLV